MRRAMALDLSNKFEWTKVRKMKNKFDSVSLENNDQIEEHENNINKETTKYWEQNILSK